MSANDNPSGPRPLTLYSQDGGQWALYSGSGTEGQAGAQLSWTELRAAVAQLQGVLTKICIGAPGGALEKEVEPLHETYAMDFPELAALHLWGIPNWNTLPALPGGLEILEIQALAQLDSIPTLPEALEILVVDDCPKLASIDVGSPPHTYSHLRDLSLRGATGLDQVWVQRFLEQLPQLQFLDLSGWSQLTSFGRDYFQWPESMESVKLNDCAQLVGLPAAHDSGRLRRLELRGTALKKTPKRWGPLDYVDFRGMRQLRQCPKFLPVREGRRFPRTLYLYNSGIKRPPASEHGLSAEENVARNVEGYFADIDDLGEREVERCKLLLLGNGAAGKSSLAATLMGRVVSGGSEWNSTDGVSFFQRAFNGQLQDGSSLHVKTHIWDFGGQALYHNTHRRFMEKGSVYVVLWRFSQVDSQPDEENPDFALQDRWRNLRYWLDLIRLSCPTGARVAVVCSHDEEWSDAKDREAIRARFKKERATDDPEITLFFVDVVTVGAFESQRLGLEGTSLGPCKALDVNAVGRAESAEDAWRLAKDAKDEKESRVAAHRAFVMEQWACLNKWIGDAIAETVHEQGAAVPAHWEIGVKALAENLAQTAAVEGDGGRLPAQMSIEDFQFKFEEWIAAASQYEALCEWKEVATESVFENATGQDRLRRALAYFTNIGMALWDRSLLPENVILDQEWAMKGVYRALPRWKDDPFCALLQSRGGKFTRQDLVDHAWEPGSGQEYSEDEQKVLLGFMERVQACFRLGQRGSLDWIDSVYVSFAHLKKRNSAFRGWFQKAHPASTEPAFEEIQNRRMSEANIHRIIAGLAQQFGSDAEYAQDGFYLPANREGQTIWIEFKLDEDSGIGGAIRIHVGDTRIGLENGAQSVAKNLREELKSWLPDEKTDQMTTASKPVVQAAGGRRQLKVFFSYAWGPKAHEGENEPQQSYQEPVDQIEAALRRVAGDNDDVEIRRDRKWMQDGESISEYVHSIGKADRVIMVTSDAFYRSWYCMYEYISLEKSFIDRGEKLKDVLFVVRLPTGILNDSECDKLRDFWMRQDSVDCPSRLRDAEPKGLRSSILNVFENKGNELQSDRLNRHLDWDSSDPSITERVAKFVFGGAPTG